MLNLFNYNGHIFSRNLLTNQQAQSHQNLVYNRTWLLTKPTIQNWGQQLHV